MARHSNEAIDQSVVRADAAPTAQITATLQNTTTALVTWQTANARRRDQRDGGRPEWFRPVAVSAQTTFTLVARAADGRTATASATVTPTIGPAPTAQITATLSNNNTANVSWQTTNAVSASINGTAVAPVRVGIGFREWHDHDTRSPRAAADGRDRDRERHGHGGDGDGAGCPEEHDGERVRIDRATLNWQPPTNGGTPTHYLLYVGTRTGTSNVVERVQRRQHVAGDRRTAARHLLRARACRQRRWHVADVERDQFRIGRKLATPTGFTVTWSGTAATLSWTAPAADAAEDVPANYVLEAGTAPGRSDAAVVQVGNVTSFSADVSYGTYYVRVRAENAYGDSDPTEDLEVRAPGSPQAPTRAEGLRFGRGRRPSLDRDRPADTARRATSSRREAPQAFRTWRLCRSAT